jgi:uncharacterized protein (TIGR02996 family)
MHWEPITVSVEGCVVDRDPSMCVEDAFISAILNTPFDDTPRLAFADWLEERGSVGGTERAEFIRLSVREPDRTFWPPASTADGSTPTAD